MLSYIKKVIQKSNRISIIIAFFYTHLFGFNRILGKRFNKIRLKNSFVKNSTIIIKGKNNTIYISKHCMLHHCTIYIKGNNNKIYIENNVSIVKGEIHMEDDNNVVGIGKSTHISGLTHLACIEGCSILIGENCLFSSDITFRTGDSHSIMDSNGKRTNFSKSIVIGNHVWIGNKVILTKGVKVSDNSIIATGAILTKQYNETGVILGGVPASVIKREINWEERRR